MYKRINKKTTHYKFKTDETKDIHKLMSEIKKDGYKKASDCYWFIIYEKMIDQNNMDVIVIERE